VHEDVAEAVDTLLRGFALQPEIRYRDEHDEIHIQKPERRSAVSQVGGQGLRRSFPNGSSDPVEKYRQGAYAKRERPPDSAPDAAPLSLEPIAIYAYGVARNRLEQTAKKLGVPAKLVRDPNQASVLITLKSYYRKRQKPILSAEEQGIPIYVLRSNSFNQMEQVLAELFNISESSGRNLNIDEISEQTQSAIESVLNGQRWVDLPPASARVRRIQHDLVREADLTSHSYGKDPNRHVRVFRE